MKQPTIELDMLVDLFFMIEIALHFFIGMYIQGKYVDDLKVIQPYEFHHAPTPTEHG